MNVSKAILALCLIIMLTACEKTFFEEDLATTNPHENLEYLWKECHEKYAYFHLKGVDWNSVKSKYSEKLYHGMAEDSLFSVLGGMLAELKDDHANLISDFNTSFYGVKYTAPDNFDWRVVVDEYISSDYYLSGPFAHNFIANGEIGYIRLSSFAESMEPEALDFILNRYKNTKGLVLDLRENGGGKIANVFQVLSRFVDQETTVYYSRLKAGPGHNDFTQHEAADVQPYDGTRYSNRVMVLVDRGTYSSGSLLALATKALPNLSLVGDTTGGGLGMPNGGQLPNGWRYRFSITQTLTIDGKPDYEMGVPPDFYARLDKNDLSKDEVLDKAVEELLK